MPDCLATQRPQPRRKGLPASCARRSHYWGRSRKGRWVVQRKTAKDRFTRALREIGHWPVAAQQVALRRKLQGHYAYYGITGNARALGRFLYEVRRLWRKWLHRRSWRGKSLSVWLRAIRSLNRVLFTVFTAVQRLYSSRSRMPESGKSGSVGAAGGYPPAATRLHLLLEFRHK